MQKNINAFIKSTNFLLNKRRIVVSKQQTKQKREKINMVDKV
jgi:hypothetical protein